MDIDLLSSINVHETGNDDHVHRVNTPRQSNKTMKVKATKRKGTRNDRASKRGRRSADIKPKPELKDEKIYNKSTKSTSVRHTRKKLSADELMKQGPTSIIKNVSLDKAYVFKPKMDLNHKSKQGDDKPPLNPRLKQPTVTKIKKIADIKETAIEASMRELRKERIVKKERMYNKLLESIEKVKIKLENCTIHEENMLKQMLIHLESRLHYLNSDQEKDRFEKSLRSYSIQSAKQNEAKHALERQHKWALKKQRIGIKNRNTALPVDSYDDPAKRRRVQERFAFDMNDEDGLKAMHQGTLPPNSTQFVRKNKTGRRGARSKKKEEEIRKKDLEIKDSEKDWSVRWHYDGTSDTRIRDIQNTLMQITKATESALEDACGLDEKLLDEFEVDLKGKTIEAKTVQSDTCKKCSSPMRVSTSNMIMVCPKCGYEMPYLEAIMVKKFKDPIMETETSSTYDRLERHRQVLNQIQGKERRRIPLKLRFEVMEELWRNRVPLKAITVGKINRIQKDLQEYTNDGRSKKFKHSTYYMNSTQLFEWITGIMCTRIPKDIIEKTCVMFLELQVPFQTVPSLRTNFVNYHPCAYHIFDQLGYVEYLEYFNRLQGNKNEQQQAEVFEAMGRMLGWDYKSNREPDGIDLGYCVV